MSRLRHTTSYRLASPNQLAWYRAWTGSMLIGLGMLAGCVQSRYYYGKDEVARLPLQDDLSPSLLVGGPQPQLDRIESAVHWPRQKFQQWRSRAAETFPALRQRSPVRSHDEAVAAAMSYLEDNGLHDVIVESRHHDPAEQWKRLQNNPGVHPLWRYTDGVLRVGTYALLPPRVLRVDTFNPYTRTLSINSGRPASAVYQAARAKEFASTPWPGFYAASSYVPLVPVAQEIAATNDALTYAREKNNLQLERDLYPWTYGSIASSALTGGLAIAPELQNTPLLSAPLSNAAGLVSGSIAGGVVAERVAQRVQRTNAEQDNTSEDSIERTRGSETNTILR